MNLEELLNHKSLVLPKNWRNLGYASYYECVVKEGESFLKLISNLDESEEYGESEFLGKMNKGHLQSSAKMFFEAVIAALESYLNEGSPHKAYSVLNDVLNIDAIAEGRKSLAFYLDFKNLYPEHYRLRTKEDEAELSDLFHIPFYLRHKVNSNRYSIPGYPTLYFSNSIFLAYKELENPDYDDLFASKFIYTKYDNQTETLLDMTNRPMWNNMESKFKFLVRWMLTMSCSVKVGFPNSPFKPEYIIPQIILQWVKNNINVGKRKVIGVTYSSTKIIDNKEEFNGHFYNTAIPIHIHSLGNNGYCDVLSKQFSLTKPINFNNAMSMNKDVNLQGQVKTIELNGAKVEYVNSDFGKIEQILSEKPYSELFYINGN